jgi:hypothetical protein
MAFANLILCVGIFLPTVGVIALLFPEPLAEAARNAGLKLDGSAEIVRGAMRKFGVVTLVAGALLLAIGWFVGVGPGTTSFS